IRLDEIQPGKSKSFEEARSDLEAQLRRDRATDRFGEVQEQLQAKVAEPGADLGSLAQQYGLLTGNVASFVKGAGGPPLGLAAAEGARAKLEGGMSFEALAQELKVHADPAHFVGRRDPSIPAPVRDAVFAAPRPAGKPVYRALALGEGGAAVVAVMGVRTAAARDPKTLGDRALQEAERLGTDAATAYVEDMRR